MLLLSQPVLGLNIPFLSFFLLLPGDENCEERGEQVESATHTGSGPVEVLSATGLALASRIIMEAHETTFGLGENISRP